MLTISGTMMKRYNAWLPRTLRNVSWIPPAPSGQKLGSYPL